MRLDRTFGLSALALALAGLTGCDGGTGDLSGKVSYKGKTLVSGTVTAVGRDGVPHVATISQDGSYSIAGLPTGEVKLAVMSPNPVEAATARTGRGGAARGGGRGAEARAAPDTPAATALDPALMKGWFLIPPEAGDVATSGLKVTVKKGANPHDIVIP